MEHSFTSTIKSLLEKQYGKAGSDLFDRSLLLQYINEKTRSANKGSKSRSSFASLYALYVIAEDYVQKSYHKKGDYSKYEGASFSSLFTRQRELPFGSKLQNHALNNRVNSEFQKYFPTSRLVPILRDLNTNRYWLNQNLLRIKIGKKEYNISEIIIEIINHYISTKQEAFDAFIKTCFQLSKIKKSNPKKVEDFILGLLKPNVDARLFEIVSYSILKYYYHDKFIIWGFDEDSLTKDNLKLYKTGRTNANDGGIDFVMRPLGRFFQVTETLDFKKYFLDIDKIQKFPITFVIKSELPDKVLLQKIREKAKDSYTVAAIVKRYMDCIEEVINIPTLIARLAEATKDGHLSNILEEILSQSKIEFNIN